MRYKNENIEDFYSCGCFFFFTLNDRESGEPSKRKSYLPSEKQFLITRNGKFNGFRVSGFLHFDL